jgi:hypothetical protein
MLKEAIVNLSKVAKEVGLKSVCKKLNTGSNRKAI